MDCWAKLGKFAAFFIPRHSQMQHRHIYKEGNPRLIIIFAGWAMDAAPFAGLRRPGYDIMVVWDYRSPDIDWSCVSGYAEICVVAWSLGVYSAARAIRGISSRVTLRLAVNGTMSPVDRLEGIPDDVFDGTLAGLDERNLTKFYRRVSGSRAAFESFSAKMPRRSITELKAELALFRTEPILENEIDGRWDRAVIGRDDAIFPPANQCRAWAKHPYSLIDAPHLPDFQFLLDRYVVDKDMTGKRFAAGEATYDSEASVQSGLVERMRVVMERASLPAHMCRRGSRTIEIGSGTGKLSKVLDGYAGRFGFVEMWDMASGAPLSGPMRKFRTGDAELIMMREPSGSADFIVSASTVQWFNSPSRFLCECLRVLAPGGCLLVGTYVEGNLAEISSLTGRGLPLLSLADWLKIVPAGLDVALAEEYTEVMEFDSAIDIFRHLKATGVNSLGRGEAGLRGVIRSFPASLDGKYRISYKPAILLLYKK